MGRIETADLDLLLAPLTEDQREVIVLRMVADLSLEETANVVGKRIGAVKALQRRALANLKTHLESTGVSK
jgi:RNA polymerase sigma-70 factor (ECF subfamily)